MRTRTSAHRLDLGRIASDDSGQRNRFHLLARLTWADSAGEAAQLLMDARGWLDLAAEDEQDLFRDYVDWLYALEPDGFPHDWDPDGSWRLASSG